MTRRHVLFLHACKAIAAPTVLPSREALPDVDKMTPMLIHWPRKMILSPETIRNVVKHVLLVPPGQLPKLKTI